VPKLYPIAQLQFYQKAVGYAGNPVQVKSNADRLPLPTLNEFKGGDFAAAGLAVSTFS
jgi:hypothetical protein